MATSKFTIHAPCDFLLSAALCKSVQRTAVWQRLSRFPPKTSKASSVWLPFPSSGLCRRGTIDAVADPLCTLTRDCASGVPASAALNRPNPRTPLQEAPRSASRPIATYACSWRSTSPVPASNNSAEREGTPVSRTESLPAVEPLPMCDWRPDLLLQPELLEASTSSRGTAGGPLGAAGSQRSAVRSSSNKSTGTSCPSAMLLRAMYSARSLSLESG
mmetsp:Transcript_88203/g.175187  ORF Transcript_88203/g.175187 Transcript_88203/m.175187 type:complete len:217 (+) Transcript_88203:891-1541(+)